MGIETGGDRLLVAHRLARVRLRSLAEDRFLDSPGRGGIRRTSDARSYPAEQALTLGGHVCTLAHIAFGA